MIVPRRHARYRFRARRNHKNQGIRALKNGGVAASRNLIIKNTEADFIVFFDDDDVSEPNRISEQLKIIKACEQGDHTKLVISHTARLVTYSESLTRYEKALAQAAGPLGVSGPKVSEAILCGTNKKELRGACPTCSQMARVSTYLELNGFDEISGEVKTQISLSELPNAVPHLLVLTFQSSNNL